MRLYFSIIRPRANGRNIVGCSMLCPFACRCLLLGVVVVKLLSQLPAFLLFRDRRSIAQHGSVNTAHPTAHPKLWRPRTRITNGLRLMGCILPTMHCRSQHCWEASHPFAHNCQHGRNNSHHCWPNNVGSCCVRLHVALRNLSNNDDGFMSKQQLSTCTLFYWVHLFDVHYTTTTWNLLIWRFMEDVNILSLFEAG